MNFELTDDQRAVIDAAVKLFRRHGGPQRARDLLARCAYDDELAAALAEAGFDAIARGGATGPLEGALVLEAAARHAALVAYGAAALVAPALTQERFAAPIGLAVAGQRGPVRYGAQVRTLFVLDDGFVRVRPIEPGDARPVRSSFGYPMAEVPVDGGDRIDGDAADRMRAWWRVALAIEMVGTMRAAFELTVSHVKTREQFGQPIGAFQALQHRLAECTVLIEGARWLALETAWHGAPSDAAELTAAHAAMVAKRVFHEAHQLHGAMGLTREHDLFLWTTRLPALAIELPRALDP